MMRDCPDGNIRDLLPGFVCATLPRSEHARVAAHVAGCADCAMEVELIRSAGTAFPAPRVDTERIIAALPSAPARTDGLRSRRWRLAAAISFVVLGGATLLSLQGVFDRAAQGRSGASSPSVGDGRLVAGAAARGSTGTPAESAQRDVGLGFGGGLSDLTDDQLQTLLRELEAVEPLPNAEPDAHTTPIGDLFEGGDSA